MFARTGSPEAGPPKEVVIPLLDEMQRSESWLVTVTAQDRPGVIAKIARALDDLGCDLVVASTGIVVGQVTIMAIASTRGDSLKPEALRGALDRLDPALGSSSHLVPVPARAPVWPESGAELHRLRVAVEEQPGAFYALTLPIANHDVPLWVFSTWVEESGWCMADVVVAPSQDVDAYTLGEEIHKTVLRELDRYRKISWSKISHLPLPQVENFIVPERGIALSVVGFARPAFVRGALEVLAEREISVVGSAMAILGAYTGLLMVVDGSKVTDVDELGSAIRRRLHEHDNRIEEPFESQVDVWLIEPGPASAWPFVATHIVRCEARRNPRSLVQVLELLSNYVNVVRVRSGIREDSDGSNAYVLDLAVASLPGTGGMSAAAVGLNRLARADGWNLRVTEAQPDPQDVQFSHDPATAPSVASWLAKLAAMPRIDVLVDPTDDIRQMRDTVFVPE